MNKDEVIELKGSNPGQTSIILVGVHGNEICGVEAMDQILPNLKIETGKVLIAYANPKAIEQKVRFTETNLNRMFLPESEISEEDKNSYEYSRAQYLKRFLSQADALLDVHASSNTKSIPFIICERNSKKITDSLPIETVVYGFDAVEPGGTDYYMNSIGKIGVCVECGNMEDPKSTENAIESIYTFLKIQGHISGETPTPVEQKLIQMYYLHKAKTDNFTLAKPFDDFESLTAEQFIAHDGDEEIKTDRESIIIFAKNSTEIGREVFLLGEPLN